MRTSPTWLPTSLILLPLCVAVVSASCRVVREPDPSLEPAFRSLVEKTGQHRGIPVGLALVISANTLLGVRIYIGLDDPTPNSVISKDILLSEGTVRAGAGSFSKGELACTD